MTKKQRFIKFLKDEGIFEHYKNNWDHEWAPKPIVDPEDYIDDAFCWDRSPERCTFWDYKDDQWQEILKKEYE